MKRTAHELADGGVADLIDRAVGVVEGPLSVLLAVLVLPLVHCLVFELVPAFTVPFAVTVLAVVDVAVRELGSTSAVPLVRFLVSLPFVGLRTEMESSRARIIVNQLRTNATAKQQLAAVNGIRFASVRAEGRPGGRIGRLLARV